MPKPKMLFGFPQYDVAGICNVGRPAGEPVDWRMCSQVDLVQCDQTLLHNVLSVTVRRDMPLSSHNSFLEA